MIDIENKIFDSVATALEAKFNGIFVTSMELRVPTLFPAVSIVEIDNQTWRGTLDTASEEHHARIVYEVNVYSNKTDTRRSEVKAIFSVLDKVLFKLGFLRIMRRPISMDDATLYRMVGRYQGVASKEGIIYRR